MVEAAKNPSLQEFRHKPGCRIRHVRSRQRGQTPVSRMATEGRGLPAASFTRSPSFAQPKRVSAPHAQQESERQEREAVRGSEGQGDVEGAGGEDRQLARRFEPRWEEVPFLGLELEAGRHHRSEEDRRPQGRPCDSSQVVERHKRLLRLPATMRGLAGEFPSGQRGRAVNPLAQPSEVRILSPPYLCTQA
jgi:hypothetical protein